MAASDFEDELAELIKKHQANGMSIDEIISSMELAGMALEDEGEE